MRSWSWNRVRLFKTDGNQMWSRWKHSRQPQHNCLDVTASGNWFQQPINCLLTSKHKNQTDRAPTFLIPPIKLTLCEVIEEDWPVRWHTSHFSTMQHKQMCHYAHLWLSCEPRKLDMVSSKFWRRSRTFCTVRFLWDSGSDGQPGGGKKKL